MTTPAAPEPLAGDVSEPQKRPSDFEPTLADDGEPSKNPIRLTGNTVPGDPFSPAAEESVLEQAPEAETSDADLAGDDEINHADRAADADAESFNLGDVAVDDSAEMKEVDGEPFAQDASDQTSADDGASASDLAEGPLMAEPETDGLLPEFAQRSTDNAPSGEPFPADVQDERIPPREPEPGDESLDGGTMPERCPSPRDLKPINQITHRIAAEPGLFPQECVLSDEPFVPRNFACTVFTWKASALCHKPLYFQQAKLERYGHTFGPVLTPVLSTGHFFVSVFALPYKIGMNPPWECMYPLGWYRPGSCAPYTLGPVPISLRGAALQGVVTTGLWFLFP